MRESKQIKEFFGLVAQGFCMEGELPAGRVDGVEVKSDGHAIAMVEADGRVLPIRFTFDDGKIARVEVL